MQKSSQPRDTELERSNFESRTSDPATLPTDRRHGLDSQLLYADGGLETGRS